MESVITHLKDREIDPELELEIRDTRVLLQQQMESASNNRKDSSNYIMSDISNIDDSNHHNRAFSDRDRERDREREGHREREMERETERDRDREGHRRQLGSTFDLISAAEAVSPIRPGRSLDLPHEPGPRPFQTTTGFLDTAERFHSMGHAFSASNGAMQYPDSMHSHTAQNHRFGKPINEQSEPRISRTANSSLTFSPFQKDQKAHIGLNGMYCNTQAHTANTLNGHAYVHQSVQDGPAPPGPIPQIQVQNQNQNQIQNSIPSQQMDRMHYNMYPQGQNISFTGPFPGTPRPTLAQDLSSNSNHTVHVPPVGHSVSVTGSGSGTGAGAGTFPDLFSLKKDPTNYNGVSHGLGEGIERGGTVNSTPVQTRDGTVSVPPGVLSGAGTFSSSQNIPSSVYSVRTPYDARTSYSSSDSTYTSQTVNSLTKGPRSFLAVATTGAPTDRYSSSRMTDFGRNLQLLSQKLDALDSYGQNGGTRTSQH
jgi:hypothetical protein